MWLKIVEIIVKIATGIILLALMPIAIVIAGAKTLFDGIRWGYWHGDDWEELPELIDDLVEHFKTPIFD